MAILECLARPFTLTPTAKMSQPSYTMGLVQQLVIRPFLVILPPKWHSKGSEPCSVHVVFIACAPQPPTHTLDTAAPPPPHPGWTLSTTPTHPIHFSLHSHTIAPLPPRTPSPCPPPAPLEACITAPFCSDLGHYALPCHDASCTALLSTVGACHGLPYSAPL